MDGSEKPSQTDARYLLRAAPHGCLVIAWAYVVFSPFTIIITIAWVSLFVVTVAILALPRALVNGCGSSARYHAAAHTAWLLLALCLQTPRTFGLLSAQAEKAVYTGARAALDYILPPTMRPKPGELGTGTVIDEDGAGSARGSGDLGPDGLNDKPQDHEDKVSLGAGWLLFSVPISLVFGLPVYAVLAPWPYIRALLNREMWQSLYLDAWCDSSARVLLVGGRVLASRQGKFEPAHVIQVAEDDWFPDEKLQNNQIFKMAANVKFDSDSKIVERLPGKMLKDFRWFNTRSLLLLLLVLPTALLIGIGLGIQESSLAGLSGYVIFCGLWNGGLGFVFLCYIYFKRFNFRAKAVHSKNDAEGLVEFWETFPALEQGAAAAVGLISFMGGVAALCRTLVDPPGTITLVTSAVAFPYYVFGPLLLVYIGGDHCRRVLLLSCYEVGQTVIIACGGDGLCIEKSLDDGLNSNVQGLSFLEGKLALFEEDDATIKLRETELRAWKKTPGVSIIEAPERHPSNFDELSIMRGLATIFCREEYNQDEEGKYKFEFKPEDTDSQREHVCRTYDEIIKNLDKGLVSEVGEYRLANPKFHELSNLRMHAATAVPSKGARAIIRRVLTLTDGKLCDEMIQHALGEPMRSYQRRHTHDGRLENKERRYKPRARGFGPFNIAAYEAKEAEKGIQSGVKAVAGATILDRLVAIQLESVPGSGRFDGSIKFVPAAYLLPSWEPEAAAVDRALKEATAKGVKTSGFGPCGFGSKPTDAASVAESLALERYKRRLARIYVVDLKNFIDGLEPGLWWYRVAILVSENPLKVFLSCR